MYFESQPPAAMTPLEREKPLRKGATVDAVVSALGNVCHDPFTLQGAKW